MADILLTRQAVLLAKSESTYGTYNDPATTDAVLTTIPSFSFEVETYEREMARSSLSPLPPRTTNIDVGISFSCEVKGSGTAGTAPEVAPLLLACGMVHTDLTAINMFGMKSDPSVIPPVSLKFYWGGHMYKVAGCIGNFSCSFEAGGIGLFNFEFKGKYLGNALYDTSETIESNPTYDTTLPPLLNTAELTFDSDTSLDISKMEFNLNNEVTSIKNIGDAQPSSTRFFISGRKPSGSFDPLVDKTSFTPHWFELLENATGKKMQLTLEGEDAGNRVAFYFGGTHNGSGTITTVAQNTVTGLSFDDDSGVRRFGVSFNMSGNFTTGDDELWIRYY